MNKLWSLLAIVVVLECTAYCHTGNPTASGVMPQVGMCAMDRLNGVTVPFGTKVHLPDGRTLVVTDRFGDGRSNCLDIFMASEDECWQFGRRWIKCEVEM